MSKFFIHTATDKIPRINAIHEVGIRQFFMVTLT